MCYNYTGSKFRLSMPYFSVGIIFSKHSIVHQGRTQEFSKGVSKEGIAKAISTAYFVPACAWCTQALCSEKSVTLRGFPETSETPCICPCTPTAGPRGFSRQSYYCTQHAHTYRIQMSGHCASTKSYMYMCGVMGH